MIRLCVVRCSFCFSCSHLFFFYKSELGTFSEIIRPFSGTLCDAWLQTGGLGSWQWPGGNTSYLSHPPDARCVNMSVLRVIVDHWSSWWWSFNDQYNGNDRTQSKRRGRASTRATTRTWRTCEFAIFTDLFSLVVNDVVFDYGMFWRIVTESFWEKFSHDLPRSKLVNTRFCFQVRPEQAHLQSGQNKAPLGKKMFCYPCSHQCLLHQSLLNGEHFSRSSFKMLSLLYECLKQCWMFIFSISISGRGD